ncbi:hypothetical protein BRC86_04780 [Halobacteriales archaeon QS_3_64_16]|nr:MAG: hypothetical protein BRC86_04780 [Halobacteriales archaeon QS_3_64_16]
MVECRYCGREFEDDSAHREHLRDSHTEELGPIDRRRLDAEGSERSRTPIYLAGIVLVLALGVMAGAGYVLLDGGRSGSGSAGSASGGGGAATGPGNVNAVAQTPTGVGSVHTHGTIEMRVTGQQVDFSQSQYQLQADAFHFENSEGSRWHVHAQGVTLEYAMSTLDIGVTNDSVTYEGETYRGGPNTTVTVRVNGSPVQPSEYVLQEGDQIRIIVEEN